MTISKMKLIGGMMLAELRKDIAILDKKRSEISQLEQKIQSAEAQELSIELLKFFQITLKEYFDLDFKIFEWCSMHALAEVAEHSIKSYSDFRHRYPHSITALKNVSIVAFWISKIKPVNPLAFFRDDGHYDCSDINERLALAYIERSIVKLVESGGISEFIPPTEENIAAVRSVFEFYIYADMYVDDENKFEEAHEKQKNNKSYETKFYMRFKKMTAINIYESITHLLIPIRCGVHLATRTT